MLWQGPTIGTVMTLIHLIGEGVKLFRMKSSAEMLQSDMQKNKFYCTISSTQKFSMKMIATFKQVNMQYSKDLLQKMMICFQVKQHSACTVYIHFLYSA